MPLLGALGDHNKYKQLSRYVAKERVHFRVFSANPVPKIRKDPEKWTFQSCRSGAGLTAMLIFITSC